MAVQEQWVRLAPAFVAEDPEDGVPVHEMFRFTDVSVCVIVFLAFGRIHIKRIAVRCLKPRGSDLISRLGSLITQA